MKRERFFTHVYFSNETVSQTTVSTGPMKMFRLEHETMNAEDLSKFAKTKLNLKTPAPSRYRSENVQLKRRIFFCVDKVDRDCHRRYFKEEKGSRAIHIVLSGSNSCSIRTCQLSCYCENCIEADYEACQNSDYVSAQVANSTVGDGNPTAKQSDHEIRWVKVKNPIPPMSR